MQQSVQGNPGSFAEYDSANQDLWLASYFNMQQQAPYSLPHGEDSEMMWQYVVEQNHESLVDERMFMQNFSDHRPKNPVTGVLPDDSSDSDTDSMVNTLHKTYHQNLFQFSHLDFWLLIDWWRHFELYR